MHIDFMGIEDGVMDYRVMRGDRDSRVKTWKTDDTVTLLCDLTCDGEVRKCRFTMEKDLYDRLYAKKDKRRK